jgi:Tfp pilus assembly protein PilX
MMRKHRARGFILIMTLLICTALMLLVMAAMRTHTLESAMSMNFVRHMKQQEALR